MSYDAESTRTMSAPLFVATGAAARPSSTCGLDVLAHRTAPAAVVTNKTEAAAARQRRPGGLESIVETRSVDSRCENSSDPPELIGERTRSLISLVRIVSERTLDDADERVGQIRTRIAQATTIASCVCAADVVLRVSLNRIPTGYEVIQQHPEAVDVRHGGRTTSLEQFGCEICGCACQVVAPARLRDRDISARAEVHEHNAAAFFAHDVGAFDVAVQEAGAVHRGERVTEIDPDRRRFPRAKGALRRQEILECASLAELHPDADAVVG